MQVVNYTHARKNLKAIIDDLCDNNEDIIVLSIVK